MLDTPTLFAVNTFVSILVAVLVLSVWRRDNRYGGMRPVKLGISLLAGGFVGLGLMRENVDDSLTMLAVLITGNFLIALGSMTTIQGITMLAGGRAAWRRNGILCAMMMTAFIYYLLVDPKFHIRVLLMSSWSAFLCFDAVIAVLRRHQDGTSRATRMVFFGTMVVHGIAESVRGLGAPYIYPISDMSAPNPVMTAFLIEYMSAIVAATVLALQMVSERLQRDLQQSEARIASAFEVASDAFAVFDGSGHLRLANPRFAEIFPDEAPAARPGTALDSLLRDKPERFGLAADWLNRDGEGFSVGTTRDRIVQLPGGAWVHVSASTTAGGGLVLCWSDITDFKQAEAVLANELAREREQAAVQRSFVSMASHQFRTPLSIIDINAQLIERQRTDTAERTGRIRRTVRRMINLIEVMLGAASAEAGKIELKRGPQDLTALVGEASERVREVSPNRVIDLDLGNLPPSVNCDANLIDQVLGNLLSNAIKYSSKTQKVTVAGATEGNTAVIRVTDYGVGIAPEDQPLIFERFFRADNATGVAGTGIGLTLARYIVDLHGGDISVQSSLGAGSTFTVRLPIS